MCQEAAQALIYAGMAGSKLDGIQDKVNEYLDRVQALHNAGMFKERLDGGPFKQRLFSSFFCLLLFITAMRNLVFRLSDTVFSENLLCGGDL